jgi:tetratricopeptide (TPR) repeat protein
MRRVWQNLVCAGGAVLVLGQPPSVAAQSAGVPRGSAQAAALRGIRATPPLTARLWLSDRKDRDAALVGSADDRIACTDPAAPATVQDVIEKAVIQRAAFELTLDQGALAEAERNRDWVSVYRLLSATLAPALPYLDLPDNNAAEPVWRLGGVMLRIADQTLRGDPAPEARERVVQQYAAAKEIYRHLARAVWSPLGEQARIREVQCLLKMGQSEPARTAIEQIREPLPGDSAYGLYWLTRGWMAAQAGDTNAALDAAVLSLAFENKDIESFPDALLLSGHCYEALQEWHRARDVFFEVASLFPGTDWADDAARDLERVLATGRTGTPEDVSVEGAFFGYREDLEELSRTLLKNRAAAGAP